jgi:3D (Asp-Asp-Asp) domain-containing protein
MYSLRSPLLTGGGRPVAVLRALKQKHAQYVSFVISQVHNADRFTQIMLAVSVLVLGIAVAQIGGNVSSGAHSISALDAQAEYVGDRYATFGEFDATSSIMVTANALRGTTQPPHTRPIVAQRLYVPMTAYSSTVDQTDASPFITASGTHVRDGIVAANFLPIGTKVRIPSMYGDKVFVVEDRMNSRYWIKMDIWMETREEALQFGVRTLPVEIIQEI